MNYKPFLTITLVFFLLYSILLNHKVYIGKSSIDGKGLFTKRNIKKGEYLFDTAYYDKDDKLIITRIGSLIKHCRHQNTKISIEDNVVKIYATESIEKDIELVIDYDIVSKKIAVQGSKKHYKCNKKNYVR